MNAIQILATQAWVERLGLTLLHFVWQGTIIVTMYAVVRKWGARTLGPGGRYFLACAVLTAMAIIPIVTWMLLPVQKSAAVTFSAPMSAPRAQSVPTIPFLLPSTVYAATPGHFLSWVVTFWMIGATAFSLRLLSGWILAQRFRHRMVRAASLEWQRRLNRLKACISVARPVRLLVSGLIEAPGSIGWFRPIVLVPAGALAGLPCALMEALLLHELAHIRRHDYLVHILQSLVETVLFYHPGVWWVSGHMRTDRELCCDDIAVSVTGDAVVYARALAEFDSARFIQPAVLAANGGSVARRIARLLGQSSTAGHATRGTATVQALMLLAIGAWAVFAQTATRPQFEVASIKPSYSDSIMNVRPLPGRLTADATLQVLMQYAYGVAPFQVVGGPGWLTSERYQIDATANATASRDRIFLMLQSLLEDRFQLKTHRDTREQPVFALVADKGGVKLPSPKESVCVDSPADAATEWVGGGRMAAPGEVQPAKGRCGSAVLGLGPGGAQMHGGKIAMPELVRTLSMLLGRSVIDKTGFTELFDLQLDFVPDDTTPAMPPPPPGSYSSGVSIAQALQQQLGLRLESTKGPVQVIVVDRAERPSAN
jgi:bla regulator protein blaR1